MRPSENPQRQPDVAVMPKTPETAGRPSARITSIPGARMPTAMDDYLFDLRGFLLLRGVLSAEEVRACNAAVDSIPRSVPRLGWHGHVQREDHPEHRGVSYQQIYEAGAPFERLIDHPSYINYVLRYVGGQDTFDAHHGPVYIDENFFNIRGPGDAIPLHAGGHDLCKRMQFRYRNGRFACGQVNILIAYTDIGPGDGATMVIPGSHKSNFKHPGLDVSDRRWEDGGSVDGIEGAIEIHMNAGDAILFVDATCHGSARRVNPGERRISVYRYGPSWGMARWGYWASPGLQQRLGPLARRIVAPHEFRFPPASVT